MSVLRVLIVNDSATMRASLRSALELAADLQIVGEVSDGSEAANTVLALRPDVVLMDVVMPGCDGYQATRAIMSGVPTPVVMVTAAVNPRDERVIFEALNAGALSVTQAPPSPSSPGYSLACATLAQLLRSMAGANVRTRPTLPASLPSQAEVAPSSPVSAIGIVASAGGPPALVAILRQLAMRVMPPILMVQHLTRGFTPGFARWLYETTGYKVVVATHGERLLPSSVYLAPDDRHLGAARDGTALVTNDPPVGLFRPSGDYLLSSLAKSLGKTATGVVLSGMGRDGAAGALELSEAGGIVVAQDADSSAVDGMPRAVRERVSSARVLSLHAIPDFLLTMANAK